MNSKFMIDTNIVIVLKVFESSHIAVEGVLTLASFSPSEMFVSTFAGPTFLKQEIHCLASLHV